MRDPIDEPGDLEAADEDEEPDEEEKRGPLDLAQDLLHVAPGVEHQPGGPEQRHSGRFEVQGAVQEEPDYDDGENGERLAEQHSIPDSAPRVHRPDRLLGLFGGMEFLSEHEVEVQDDRGKRQEHHRGHIQDKIGEVEAGGAPDQDVGRVPYERRRTPDIRREHLTQEERYRRHAEGVGDQESYRDHQDDRGHVVQKGGQESGHDGKYYEDTSRTGLPPLRALYGEVLEDAGLVQDGDHDHHPRQKADGVPVDELARRLLLGYDAEEDHDRRPEEGRYRAVDDLRADKSEHHYEDRYGEYLLQGHSESIQFQ